MAGAAYACPADRPMAEFVIKLADERGRVQEQVQTAATAEELRARFSHAGYHVFSVKEKSGVSLLSRRKIKLENFLIFNQQFLTLIKAGLPILGSLFKTSQTSHERQELIVVATPRLVNPMDHDPLEGVEPDFDKRSFGARLLNGKRKDDPLTRLGLSR